MSKVQSATVRLVMKKCKVNSIGQHPIYLSVCYNARKEKSTGIFIEERYWNPLKEEIRSSAPNSIILNKMLNDIKQKVISRKNSFEYNGKKYTPSMLLEDSVEDLSANRNVYSVIYKNYLSEMGSSINTIRLYDYTFRVLKKYFGNDDFLINDITLSSIKKLIKDSGLSDNSIRGICGRIAAVYNYAIDKKIMDVSDYPFKDWKYSQKYSKNNRIYYLDAINLKKLRDYFLNMSIEYSGELWSYREGILENFEKRSSKEFSLMFFIFLFMCNGSSPIDAALLKGDNCSRVKIDGEDYWKICFKRKKTNRPVTCLLKRNVLSIICFEHFLGRYSGGYIYPILKEGMSDKQITNAIAKFTGYASNNLKAICQEINEATIKENVEKGLDEPLIDVDKMSLYVARHTKANDYLSHPGATIHGLATLLGRSVAGLDTYVHMISNDRDLAAAESLSTI